MTYIHVADSLVSSESSTTWLKRSRVSCSLKFISLDDNIRTVDSGPPFGQWEILVEPGSVHPWKAQCVLDEKSSIAARFDTFIVALLL